MTDSVPGSERAESVWRYDPRPQVAGQGGFSVAPGQAQSSYVDALNGHCICYEKLLEFP